MSEPNTDSPAPVSGDSEVSEVVLALSDAALAHIKKTMASEGSAGHGLRVAVVTGGCSGSEYALSFAPAPEPDDLSYEIDGLKVFIAREGADKLRGTELDYVSGLYGAGLKFRNPQAVHECGCGTSFSTE